MRIRKFLRNVYGYVSDVERKVKAVRGAKAMANAPSYFPELIQKTYTQRLRENIRWAKKYGEVNNFYALYGFDIQNLRDQEEYIDYYSFMVSRNKANRLGDWWSYAVLLRDKFLFYKFMKSNNIPVPEVFAIMINGELYDLSMNQMSWETIRKEKDFFVKDIDGECASFVKHINEYNDLEKIRKNITKGSYILQRRITQNKDMDVINSNAINTLRVITVNRDNNPYVLSALLRVGTKKTGSVDNWAAGGLAIGIEKDGFLKEYGFYKPVYGIKANVHPDTGVVFSEFKIPMYDEALALAIKAHRCFYGIRAVGWDIAISENGPVFVEGNDNFEISLQQACDRPLKREWLEACK